MIRALAFSHEEPDILVDRRNLSDTMELWRAQRHALAWPILFTN